MHVSVDMYIQVPVNERRLMICETIWAAWVCLCSLTNVPYVKCNIVPLYLDSFNGDYGSRGQGLSIQRVKNFYHMFKNSR